MPEVHLAEPTLATIRIPCRRGRPHTRLQELVADRGYDSEPLRVRWRARGIRPCIPRRRNARPRRGPKPNLAGYRLRWYIERTVAWLGNYRRIIVRYERQPQIYHSVVALACILICLKRIRNNSAGLAQHV
jgi:transposase